MRTRHLPVLAMLIGWVSTAFGQVPDLSDFHSSEDILQNYLVEADECSSDRTLLFNIAETNHLKEQGDLVLRNTVGLWIVDSKKKISYSCNQLTSDGGTARRSILFRLNGIEKGKIYPIAGDAPNGNATTIQPTPETGGRADEKRAGAFGDSHTELDPLGLPLCNYMGIRNRNSYIDSMVKVWLTKWKMKSEVVEGNLRKSRWGASDKTIESEIVFDVRSGNMPVLLRMYSVDAKGKPTKDYLSETKTIWQQRKDARWIPKRIELKTNDVGRDREATVEISQLDNEKHDSLVGEIDWSRMHSDERKDWFKPVLDLAKVKLERSGQKVVGE